MATFQKIVGSFITTVDSVAQEVEKEKIKVSLMFIHIIVNINQWL